MADNEPGTDNRIQVANARPEDAGRGIARLGQPIMARLGITEGDPVEIIGKRHTAALAVRPYPEDEGLNLIRLDGLQRVNAGVGSGDYVELRRAEPRQASRVVLAPAQKNLRLQGSADALKRTFFYRALVAGDVISTSVHHRVPPDPRIPEQLRGMFDLPAYGLQEIRLVVVSTVPRGIVQVGAETEIELRPQYEEPKEARRAEVTYDDIGGLGNTVDQVREMVELPLRHPELFQRLGIDPPKGVLLYGPPGTGKTLLARAVANETEAQFFHIAGPEIMGSHYGESEQRLRQVFQEAQAQAPSIIFIDEIDSIGRARGPIAIGGSSEQEQTLNQILTEMDGFDAQTNVIVIGATNRPEVLDPALLRPGRFDRRIAVQPPDKKGRVEILKIHTRSVPLDPSVDLEQIAASTPGATGADLALLVNEAALFAARRDHERVMPEDFTDATEKMILGAERQVVMTDADRERTAYHESGHALVGMLTAGADPVRKISIIPRGQALGVTLSTPETDRYGYGRAELIARIKVALGGRAAERVVYDEVTTGAESDIQNLTQIARSMVGRWGMSEAIGPVAVTDGRQDGFLLPGVEQASPVTQQLVDEETRRIVERAEEEVIALLERERPRLEALAHELLVRETLDQEDAYRVAGVDVAVSR